MYKVYDKARRFIFCRKGGWFYKDAQGKGHFTHGKKPKRPMFKAYTALKAGLQKRAKDIFSNYVK